MSEIIYNNIREGGGQGGKDTEDAEQEEKDRFIRLGQTSGGGGSSNECSLPRGVFAEPSQTSLMSLVLRLSSL